MEFRSDLVKGSTVPIVLRLLSERQRYGYEIVKLVNERTNGAFQWKEGTLYPCLHQLEAQRMVRSIWREAPTGRKRKYYRIMRKGRAELARRTREWTQFAAAVNALLVGAASSDESRI